MAMIRLSIRNSATGKINGWWYNVVNMTGDNNALDSMLAQYDARLYFEEGTIVEGIEFSSDTGASNFLMKYS